MRSSTQSDSSPAALLEFKLLGVNLYLSYIIIPLEPCFSLFVV